MIDKETIQEKINTLTKCRPEVAKGLQTIGTFVHVAGDATGEAAGPVGPLLKIFGVCMIQAAVLVDPEVNSDPKLEEMKEQLKELKVDVGNINEKLNELLFKSGVSRIEENYTRMTEQLDLTLWAEEFYKDWNNFKDSRQDFRGERLRKLFREVYENEKESTIETLFELFDQFQVTRLKYFLMNVYFIQIYFKNEKEKMETYAVQEINYLTEDWSTLRETAEKTLPPFFPIKCLDSETRKKFGYVPHITAIPDNEQGKISWSRLLKGKRKWCKNDLVLYGAKLKKKTEPIFMRLFSIDTREEVMTTKLHYKSLVDAPFLRRTRSGKSVFYGFVCWKSNSKTEVTLESGSWKYTESVRKQSTWLKVKEMTFDMENLKWGQMTQSEVYAHDGRQSGDEEETDQVDDDNSDESDLEETDQVDDDDNSDESDLEEVREEEAALFENYI